MRDISLDIETLDLETTAVVLSVGVTDGEQHYYAHFNLEEQIFKLKRTISANTLTWWIDNQPDMLVNNIKRCAYGKYTKQIFVDLQAYFAGPKFELWMNPPRFDGAVLENLARQYSDIDLPWTFREERCYRTLKEMAQSRHAGEDISLPPKPVNAHDALVDAKYQLEIVSRCKTILNC